MDSKLAEELKKQSPLPRLDLEIFNALRKLMPMVAVELFVTRTEGGFGLKRRKMGDMEGWVMPGGYIGFNETFEKACQRIAKRELEVEVKDIVFVHAYNWPEGSVRTAPGHAVTLVFKCETKTPSDHIAYFRQVPEGVLPHHKVMLERALDEL